MPGNRGFARKDRVAEQIRRELAELLRGEVKDPRIGMVSLTDVEVTADYAHAKVYFSTLAGKDQLAPIEAGLAKASGFLRRELGRRITLHQIPQLHFIHDESLQRGADLTQLIRTAVSTHAADDPDSTTEDSSEPGKPS